MSEYVVGRGFIREILDAGFLAGNKLPDSFWELNITGKELKVLKYVWSHVTRLYNTVWRVVPKGTDGSPRYWRDKEKMAGDCGMSAPTFRNAVRHLYTLGLTTTMDGDELLELPTAEDTVHCIGLNPQYFIDLGIQFRPDLDKSTRDYLNHLVDDICPHIYDATTVQLIRSYVNQIFQLEDKVARLDMLLPNEKDTPKELIGVVSIEENDSNPQIVEVWGFEFCPKDCYEVVLEDGWIIAVNKSVRRTPITINRISLKVPRVADVAQRRKERVEQMMKKIFQERDRLGVITMAEQKIMEVVHYYEYKCRVVTGKSGWKSLGKKFREHKNWKHFVRLYNLCKTNQWDYKVYIDAQFDRVRFWTHADCKGYPYPNQFFSEGAIKYFHKYQHDYQQRYSVDGTPARVKVSKVVSYKEEVINAVIKDCDHFVQFLKIAPKQRKYQGLTPEQMKFWYITDHVASLSHYYWASLPWAVSYLRRFSTPWVVELASTVAKIQSSQSMVSTINQIVNEVENQLGIPHTILPNVD